MGDDFDIFFAATIEALYFTDTGDDGQPDGDDELSPELFDRLEADAKSFWYRMWYFIEHDNQTPQQAGHDFWFTRNGHGSGFWDGDWPVYGDILTKLSENYGPIDTYKGDNALIYG